ncbi:hypothetical protein ACIO52_04520 [Nocardia sp. NPDC087230]|uniref:hypothetical protein n=1 Tax=Nocardia sp. NPDC087230 TaxID=3364331 RepID=UPI003829A719
MTAFMLSPDRRDQLATLLADEVRLQTEYPKVAEYLDTAAGLPGGPDPEQDRLLDLRMLHFLSGGESSNPYWDVVQPLMGESADDHRIPGGGAGTARMGYAQTVLQETYAYAIPSPGTLDWMVEVAGGRGICEVGAGRGYWAAMLAARGVEVAAYDSEPPEAAANPSFPNAAGRRAEWYPVAGLPDLEAAGFGDRVLFLCWPPGWGDPMSARVLQDYVAAGGDRLIFVGEPKGGKTGCDEFFDELSARWTLDSVDGSFVSWWNLGDVAQCWQLR